MQYITIKEIAKMAHTSTATVSKVLNNKEDFGFKISMATKKKILKH